MIVAADTSERVRKLLVEHLGVEAAKVTPEATLDDLGADSLDVVELEMALEEEFGVTIEIPGGSETAFPLDSTVDQVVAKIIELQAA